MYHSGVIYLKLQFEVLVLGNKTQVLRSFGAKPPCQSILQNKINRWYIECSVPKTKTGKREVTPRPLKDGSWVPPPPKTKCCSANVS